MQPRCRLRAIESKNVSKLWPMVPCDAWAVKSVEMDHETNIDGHQTTMTIGSLAFQVCLTPKKDGFKTASAEPFKGLKESLVQCGSPKPKGTACGFLTRMPSGENPHSPHSRTGKVEISLYG